MVTHCSFTCYMYCMSTVFHFLVLSAAPFSAWLLLTAWAMGQAWCTLWLRFFLFCRWPDWWPHLVQSVFMQYFIFCLQGLWILYLCKLQEIEDVTLWQGDMNFMFKFKKYISHKWVNQTNDWLYFLFLNYISLQFLVISSCWFWNTAKLKPSTRHWKHFTSSKSMVLLTICNTHWSKHSGRPTAICSPSDSGFCYIHNFNYS